MQNESALNRDDVALIVAACRVQALRNEWPVTIAVVDDGGHPLALERLDGCFQISAYIALDKARAAALGHRETRLYKEMINAGRMSFLSVPLDSMLEGGVPIIVDGQAIGAVGVSGVRLRKTVKS